MIQNRIPNESQTEHQAPTDLNSHAPPRTRESQYVMSLMDGVDISAVNFLDQETATDTMTQWFNDRLEHSVDSSIRIDEILDGLLNDGVSEEDLLDLEKQFVTLDDGRLIRFDHTSDYSRVRVIIGDVSESYPLVGRSPHLRLYLTDTTRDVIERLQATISDVTDDSNEVLEYSRDLLNSLLQDGASANIMISQGMNGTTAKVKEIAAAVNAVPVSDRYAALSSYLLGALTANSEQISQAQQDDPDGGSFDPTTYRGTATTSIVAGCWSALRDSALTALGTMLMVVGGPVVKIIGTVLSTGAAVLGSIKTAIDANEFARINSEGKSGLFANAIVFKVPHFDSIWHIPNVDEQLASVNPTSSVMLKRGDDFDSWLLFPSVTNPTCDQNEYPSLSADTGAGSYHINNGRLYFNMSAPLTPMTDSVINRNAVLSKCELPWMYFDMGDDRDAAIRDQIIENLGYSLWKMVNGALTVAYGRLANIPDYNVDYEITDSQHSDPTEVFSRLIGGHVPSTWSSSEGDALLEKRLYLNYVVSGITVIDVRASNDYDYLEDDLCDDGWSDLGRYILTRGCAYIRRSSSDRRLTWAELYSIMNSGVSFTDERKQALVNLINSWPNYTASSNDTWLALALKAGEWLRACYRAIHDSITRAFYTQQCKNVAKYLSPMEAILLWFYSVQTSIIHHYHSDWYNPTSDVMINFLVDGAIVNEGDLSLEFARTEPATYPRDFWVSPGDGSWSQNARVPVPAIYPPLFNRGAILTTTIIGAVTTAAVAVSAVLIKKKIRNHQKVKAIRREKAAIDAQSELEAATPGSAEYKKAEKKYIKAQKKFQRYATKVGYSSNSVGSYSSSGISEMLPTDDQCASVNPDSLTPVTRLLFGN